MASITSTGVGSGLDVNSIVTGLMSAEKQPLTLLQTRASTEQMQLSAFGKLQSQLSSLGDLAGTLGQATTWNPMLASSSDASVGASATPAAAAGTHAIEVQRLAQAQVLASGTFTSSSATVGTGTLKLELGTTAADGTFTARTDAQPVTVTIDAAHQTLAGVRDAINAAGAGVTASIVNDAAGSRLVLRTASGADASLRLTATDDDGNATDAGGLSALAYDPAAAAGSGRNLTQTQAAQDAQYTLDGVALTSHGNTVGSALDGVTLTLSKVTTGPVQLTFSQQTAGVTKNVNDFVNAWNGLNTLLRQQTVADPTGQSNGPLQGDFTARQVLTQLRTMLQGSVTGLSSSGVDSLSAAGISLQQDGSLKVDSAKLNQAMAQPGQLAKLFGQPQSGDDASSRGFAVRFKDWASALTGTGGTLTSRVDGLNREIKDNQSRQDKEQARLDRVEAQLRAQYQRLDTQMSTLNAQLAQMKSSLGLT
ncbi:flagellar filament capping protein FliD [Ramlibacter sp. MMS24-I3-19]|uniref:flagellar filament capping protein FliD n=1 Tax=Ramlibacter sp. MMS24-I3-19 TaxID=3416606 RepID=UPI003CFE86C3